MRDRKILLFDTSITMARAFEMALKNSGYLVRRTMDPEEILIEMMIFRPEVVILEKKSLRDDLKSEIEKKCKKIIYSAKTADIDGTEKYIVSRPFNTDELLRVVENLFNQNKTEKVTNKEESEIFIEDFVEEEPVIIENTTTTNESSEPSFSEDDLGDIEEDIEDFGAIEINNKPELATPKKETSAPMILDEPFEEVEEVEEKKSILVDDFVKPKLELESELSKMNKIEQVDEPKEEDEIFNMVMNDLDSFAQTEKVVYNKEYSQEQTQENDTEKDEKNLSEDISVEKENINPPIKETPPSLDVVNNKPENEENDLKVPGMEENSEAEVKPEPPLSEEKFQFPEIKENFQEDEVKEAIEEEIEEDISPKPEKTVTKSTVLEINDMDLLEIDKTKTNVNIQTENTENKRLDRLEKILSGADKQEKEKQKTIAVTREEIRTIIKEELGQIMREYFWEEASSIVKEAVENKIRELSSDE